MGINTSIWATLNNAKSPDRSAVQPSVWALPDELDAKPTQLASTPSTARVDPVMSTSFTNVKTPPPVDQNIAYDQQRLDKIHWNQEHPWGTPENHPGKMGKVAHVFSTLGNIAGDIFAPGVMARIPGTQLNMQEQEGDLAKRLNTDTTNESLNQERGAQSKNIESEIKQREQPTYTPLPTDEGYQAFNPHAGTAEPIKGENGEALSPYEKPGNLQKTTLQGPDGKPMLGFVDPRTHTTYDSDGNIVDKPVPYQKEGTPPHITAMVGGQPHIMERDPQTGAYSIDRGIAPPSYAQVAPNLRTVDIKDPDTGQNVVQTLGGKKIGQMADTSTTRSMSEMASTVIPQISAVKQEVSQLASSLGPAVGRWNQLLVNKGGTDFPEFAGLDTDLDLLASAIVRTHFGARGGQEYRQELRKMFGEAQTPEDLLYRIDHADSWIQGYARAGGHGQPQGGHGAAPPPAQQTIVQHSPTTGQYRYSTDGGKTWQAGQPNRQ